MPTRPCGLLLALALTAGPAPAQTGPSSGTVAAGEVVVRGAPQADGPDAGTLARGATVVVHHAEGDKWLAIQPPRGSVSWVNHKFIRLTRPGENAFPQNAVVEADGPVKLAVGKPGVNRPLDVRRTAVPAGTILMVIGPKVETADEGSETKWYPVEPPEDDFRYVPADAVRLDGPAAAGFAVKSPPAAAAPPPAAGSPPAGKPAGWPTHATWAQAEAAERAGELDRAERLYFQLAREMNAAGGDADLANLCYTRVHAIREKRRQAAGGADRVTWAAPDRGTPAAPASRGDLPPRRAEATPEPSPRGQWSGGGTLRQATFKVNGQPAFALEDARYRVLVYAVPAAGVDLDRYARKAVDLYGVVQYPDQLNGVGLMTVTKVDVVK